VTQHRKGVYSLQSVITLVSFLKVKISKAWIVNIPG